jgi:predicted nucleotidyltransferase
MPVTQDQIDRAVAVARRYGARRVLLFGSALDDPTTARDLDLAVEGVDGWEFFGMAAEMEREAEVVLDVISLDKDDWFTQRVRERGRPLYERS